MWQGRPAGAALFFPDVTLLLFEIKLMSSQTHPDPFLQEPLQLNQLLTFGANTEHVFSAFTSWATIHISVVSGRNYTY